MLRSSNSGTGRKALQRRTVYQWKLPILGKFQLSSGSLNPHLGWEDSIVWKMKQGLIPVAGPNYIRSCNRPGWTSYLSPS